MNEPLKIYSSATPRTLCYAVEGVAKTQIPGSWSSRPYNFREPDRTTWWLTPSPEWPAYRFGKYGFWWDPNDPGVMLSGFEVEKGVGSTAADAFQSAPGRRFVLQDDWEWLRFVRAVMDETEFDSALDRAADAVGSNVYIGLTCGIANDPAFFDPHAAALPRTTRLFVWSADNHTLGLVQSLGSTQVAPAAETATSIRELLHAIHDAVDRDWMWVSFFAGLRLKPDQGADSLGHHDVWNRCLRHFRPWVNP